MEFSTWIETEKNNRGYLKEKKKLEWQTWMKKWNEKIKGLNEEK